MKTIDQLTETERLRLALAMKNVEYAAMRFAHEKDQSFYGTCLLCEAHEFAIVLQECGMENHYRTISAVDEPCQT